MFSMEHTYTFSPPRRLGTLFHYLSIGLLAGAGLWGIWQISSVEIGPLLLVYLLAILLALLGIPLFFYRYYALRNANYTLTREGILLEWGWRKETIPMNKVHWVHPEHDLETELRPPRLRWPGSVIGTRRFTRGPVVDFMASRTRDIVVIAAADHYYAVSPKDVNKFLSAFHTLTELGPLHNLPQQSIHSTFLLTQIWKRKSAFYTILAGFLLNLTLLFWALFVIPNQAQVSLGFTPQGQPNEPLDSVRLILLPILNTFSFLANFVLGLFLFRSDENKLLAYLFWGSSILVALIFHISVYFITK